MPGVDGVWKIELDHFNYASDTSITMSYVCSSAATSQNDGLNCMNAQSPFEPDPTACEAGEQH